MIYFVHSLDDPEGLVKIGYTAGDVEKRIAGLQVGSPVRLSLLLAMDGDREAETALHRRFAKSRHHGEWFCPTRELCEYIASVGKPVVELLARKALGNGELIERYARILGRPAPDIRQNLQALVV